MIQLLNPLKAARNRPDAVDATGAAPQDQQGKAMKFALSTGDKPLAGYTIKRGVGVGGFGEVYFAVNDAGKEVALKRIQRNLDIEIRGVRQCLNLKHPNLISLYDIQFDDHQQGWIVMEYVGGPSLRDLIEQYPTGMPTHELRSWFGQIASAVTYLHDHGIVHRDLKPANIFADEGIVKIGDYGLSKFISCSRRGGQTESVGTFHYMAPEIGKGEYGKEIDIYALGVMLYEMATGSVPFDGESSQEIIMKHLTADPDLSRLASPLRETVARALQKNPASRFSDIRDMIRGLDMELDQRYMIVDRNPLDQPPVVDPLANRAWPNAPQPHAIPNPGANKTADAARRAPHATASQARLAYDLPYEEPIARFVRSTWRQANHNWKKNNLGPGARAAILAVIVILGAMNIGFIGAAIIGMATLYVPYYIVWLIIRGPAPKPSAAGVKVAAMSPQSSPLASPPAYPLNPPVLNQPVVASPGPPVRTPAPQPLSIKQWRVAKRKQLALAKPSAVGADLTASWIGASVVIAVLTALLTVFHVGSNSFQQSSFIGLIWSATMALVCSWTCIALGKRWQSNSGDPAVHRFVQLTFGLIIGGVAYLLGQYLMVPWSSIAHEELSDLPLHQWRGFFAADGTPLLAAYLAYFPLLMGSVQWWKQADPLRRTRVSLMSVVWSLLMAGLVQLIIPFPQPWGGLIFAGTSIAVQLATPWYNPDERLELTHHAS